MTKMYGYVRVSALHQSHETQKKSIIDYANYRRIELMRIFEDKASGKNVDRTGFRELWDVLQTNPQKIDAVVITNLDRMGRNLRDLLYIADWLDNHNIGLISIGNNIDTTTSEGRLFFHFMASIAEYERERISERTAEGRLEAKLKGVKFGRKRSKISMREVVRMKLEGVPLSAIARKFKVSRATIYRRLDEYEEAEHNATTRRNEMEESG